MIYKVRRMERLGWGHAVALSLDSLVLTFYTYIIINRTIKRNKNKHTFTTDTSITYTKIKHQLHIPKAFTTHQASKIDYLYLSYTDIERFAIMFGQNFTIS